MKCNQAAETLMERASFTSKVYSKRDTDYSTRKGQVMVPKVDKGWVVLPVEYMIKEPETALASIRSAKTCSCVIVDAPFVTSVEVEGIIVDAAIGVGSLVCRSDCGFKGWSIVKPAWVSGSELSEAPCYALGSSAIDLLKELGLSVRALESLEDALEAARNGGRVVVSLSDVDGLSVEQVSDVCGVIEAVNPLHPAAVIGKPYVTGCARRLAEPVAGLKRILTSLLKIKRSTVIWQFVGLGEALLLGYDYRESSVELALAAALGSLYTCGVKS